MELYKFNGKNICKLCGNSSFKLLIEKNSYYLVQCLNCKLSFVSNPPSHEELKRIYSFESGYHKNFLNDANIIKKYIKLAKKHYKFLKDIKNSGHLLDMGCSVGYFLNEAKANKWEVTGIEISQDTSDIARKKHGLNVVTGVLQNNTFEQGTFDAITMWDVLEHVNDPKAVMTIVNDALKDDGIIIVETPNIEGLFPMFSYKLSKIFNFWPHPEPPTHLFQFSKKTIKELFNTVGFKIVRIYDGQIPLGHSFRSIKSVVKNLLNSPHKLFVLLISMPFLVISAIIGPFLKQGDSITIVARKEFNKV